MTGLSESAVQRHREAFERQARKRGLPLSHREGRYENDRTNRAWMFFQAIYSLAEQANSEDRSMFTDGARKLQTDALANKAPRYLHLPTNRRYLVISDDGDSCALQGVDMRTIPVSKEALADHNVWERLP